MIAAHRRADAAGGLEHVGGVPDGFAVFVVLTRQGVQHRLADRQVAGTHQHHDAVARAFEHGHFAEDADLVESGIGAGVGQEHQAGIKAGCDAVGHDQK